MIGSAQIIVLDGIWCAVFSPLAQRYLYFEKRVSKNTLFLKEYLLINLTFSCYFTQEYI
jgi:hypothetical protein